MTLRPGDGGAELGSMLEPHGVAVHAASDQEQLRAHIVAAGEHAVVVVDTPAVAAGSEEAIHRLAGELSAAGIAEVHLTLPATTSGPAATELVERLEPLGASRIAVTHGDASSHVGPLLGTLIGSDKHVSYLSAGTEVAGGLEPADADKLAAQVLR